MEHPSQPRSFRIEGHVMNFTLYFSKVGEFSYWGQSPIVQRHSAFPMTGSNQFSATNTGGFLNGDSEYRFGEPMAHLGGGTQSSPSGVRGASS